MYCLVKRNEKGNITTDTTPEKKKSKLFEKINNDIQELRLIKAPTQMINKAVRSLIAENIVITDKFDFWLGKN